MHGYLFTTNYNDIGGTFGNKSDFDTEKKQQQYLGRITVVDTVWQ